MVESKTNQIIEEAFLEKKNWKLSGSILKKRIGFWQYHWGSDWDNVRWKMYVELMGWRKQKSKLGVRKR